MLHRWTNGRFRSTLHRVEKRTPGERYSTPFFCAPNWDATVLLSPLDPHMQGAGLQGFGKEYSEQWPWLPFDSWMNFPLAAHVLIFCSLGRDTCSGSTPAALEAVYRYLSFVTKY